MRILQVIPVLYARSGGPAKVVRSLSKELAKKHQVTVYTTSALDSKHDYQKYPNSVKSDGYRVKYFPRMPAFTSFNISPTMAKAIKRNVQKYDIVHLHSWRQFQDMTIHHYATKYKIPYVINTHGSLRRIVAKRWLKRLYDVFFGHRVLRDASKVIASNSVEAEEQKLWGVPKENIEILPNGIDLSEYSDLPPKGSFKKQFFINENEQIVLYVGRIHESKGLDLLVKSYAIVSKELSNVRLVIVGPDDGYKSYLVRLLSDLKILNKSLFTGFVNRKCKLAALVDGDVFVTPKFHSFPTAFLEACFVGCPIVTTTRELNWIHDNIGYTTESSHTALAEAIIKILCGKETQKRFRTNSTSTIRNFEISNVTSQLEAIYSQVIHR